MASAYRAGCCALLGREPGSASWARDPLVLGNDVAVDRHGFAVERDRATALRIPRTARVQLTSRAQGQKNHLTSPWARLRRDLVYRFRNLINPQSTGLKAGWVYEYDAASVEAEPESAAAD